jgi:dTDP-4-dehydrorhamnose reductase
MKKILLTGKNGQVGWELQRTLMPLGQVIALDMDEMDLADPAAIRRVVQSVRPDIIVNPAAYTAVDKAEAEPELAMAVNGRAPGILAEEASKLQALLVHYSTDYIFDGTKSSAYGEEDPANPLSVYGRTKLAGEQAIRAVGGPHLILRTSWVYGARGRNFLLTMLRLARERKELRIVDDQIGAPTWSRTLGEVTALMLAQLYAGGLEHEHTARMYGSYNLTASGSTSWFGFTSEILRIAACTPMPQLVPIATTEYPTPAARPMNSVLSNDKLARVFGLAAGSWNDNLQLCMQQEEAFHGSAAQK